jgi:hypothetical protein
MEETMTSLHDRLEGASLLERPEVRHQIERLRAQFEDLDARARQLIQRRPAVAVGTAVLVGYALARLMRGR